jgi:hypothetical protein
MAEARRVAAEGREGQGGLGVVPSADEVGGQSPATPTRSWKPEEEFALALVRAYIPLAGLGLTLRPELALSN